MVHYASALIPQAARVHRLGYTFTGTTGTAFGGPYLEQFQYTAPAFLTPGNHFLSAADLNSCLTCGFVDFNQSNDALGHLADTIITGDSIRSLNTPFVFPLGTFSALGIYALNPSLQNTTGATGTLIVSQTPELDTAAFMLLAIVLGAGFFARIKTDRSTFRH